MISPSKIERDFISLRSVIRAKTNWDNPNTRKLRLRDLVVLSAD